MKRLIVGGILTGLLIAGIAYTQDVSGIIQSNQTWWQFGPRTWFYTTAPGQFTAFQINPNPNSSPKIGTQAELTIYRINEPGAEGTREFFNILTATGYQYDTLQQNDHHVRFGMEVAFGGKHIPVFFCWEVPPGQAADCPLRIYGGDSKKKGVWICRAEGDCKDLIKTLWDPQKPRRIIGVIPIEEYP